MKIDNLELLNEFFEKERHTFPQVTYDQVRDIIAGPWRHLHKIMSEGELEEVRIKYFGNFTIYPKKVEAESIKLEKRFKAGTVSEKDYIRIKAMIKKYKDELRT